jgi:PPP family 3-phenylpropionic acid transporter
LLKPELALLMFVGALHWACQAPYMIFLVSLCEENGLPPQAPGFAVVCAVIAEFAVLSSSERLLAIMRPTSWIVLTVIATGVRWFLMANTSSVAIMLLAQLIHGLSFGVFLVAVVALLTRHIPETSRAQGQALLYLLIFGAGGILGNSGAGYIKDLAGVSALFEVVAAIQWLIAPLAIGLAIRARRNLEGA